MEEEKEHWSNFVVGSVPSLFYVPDFITNFEEDLLLKHVYQAPVSKWKSLKNRRLQNWGGIVHEKGLLAQELPPWLTRITEQILVESRLFPSPINHVLINEYLPNQGIMAHQDGPAYYPVVAIISLGSPAVMDFSPHSSIQHCTNSLENGIENEFFACQSLDMEKDRLSDNCLPFSVLLMPRSLLIFKDAAYSGYLHGIKDCDVQQCDGAVNSGEVLKVDVINVPATGLVSSTSIGKNGAGDLRCIRRTTNRISLTCRIVPKVQKKLFRF